MRSAELTVVEELSILVGSGSSAEAIALGVGGDGWEALCEEGEGGRASSVSIPEEPIQEEKQRRHTVEEALVILVPSNSSELGKFDDVLKLVRVVHVLELETDRW